MKNTVLYFLLFVSTIVVAQQEKFSTKQLQSFANAYNDIRAENEQSQLNLLAEIEKVGLTNEEFTSIHKKLKNASESSQVTPEQKRQYEKAFTNIQKFEKTTQKAFENIIKQNGLDTTTYQSIAKACSEDKALFDKVRQLMD